MYFYALLLLLLPAALLAQDRLVGLTSDSGPNGAGTAFSILSNGTGFTIHTAFLKGGYSPYGDLVQGADGNFYGTTTYGGTIGYGTIFKVTPTGTITILKNMDYYTSGGYPRGNLIRGTDGNFYGMAYYGGTAGYGTVFKITPSGTFTTLVNLNNTATGAYPYGSLVQASDGNFYGLTYQGGSNNYGTIFKMTPSGSFSVLKHLSIGTTGGYPQGSLVQGADGALYGMTSQKTSYYGTIFKITTSGTLTVLKNFDYTNTGGAPHGSLIKAVDGYFYGMTYYGGGSGYGTIFRITSGGTFTVIKKLDYTNTGGYAEASLVQGTDKLLYGMTSRGGTNGYGTIFKVSTSGGSFTVLRHLASGTTSGYPYGSLVQGSDGVFYGMSYYGGNASNSGTIFKITSTGTYTLLASLPDGGRGNNPHESLVQASDGYYYGTAKYGGTNNHGIIFKLCTDGSFKTLRSLNYSTTGGYPEGSLVQGADGNFYGMTYQGGTSGYGTIFKITPTGTLTVLKNLAGGAYSGANPYGSLVQGNDGAFYGMTYSGGANSYGIIFKITSTGTFTIIKDLSIATTGAYPYGSLIKGTDGNFYGMTYEGGAKGYGTIFKITPTGTLTVLKNFDYSTTGGYPKGNLLQNTDGNFYGMTYYGGTKSYGTIFKLTPTGTLTVLKNLDATTGGYPEGSLVRGSDGTLYGLTSVYGTYGTSSTGGTIFKITTSGTFTVLRHLKPATDGGVPMGSLVVQKAKPKAVAQSVTTAEDVAKTITLSGTGGTPLTYTISTAPKNGTLSGSAASRTYTPKANYNGKDSFYFTVTWGCQTSASAKVLITVTQVNDAPVLTHIGNKSAVKGSTLTFTATATDVDAGQTKKFSLIGAPSGATIGASSGVFSWTPTATGSYVFKVRVTDNGSPVLYDEEAITVTVTSSALTSITKAEKVSINTSQELTLTATPNPSSSYFTLQLKSNRTEAVTLKVTDALGRMIDVKTGLSPNGTVQLGHTYLAGTYMVQAQQGTESASVKLLKQ